MPQSGAAQNRLSSEAQKIASYTSDRVTISQDAIARLAEDNPLNQERVSAVGRYRDAVIRNAEADPANAEKMAADLAHDTGYS
jgi:transaldolase